MEIPDFINYLKEKEEINFQQYVKFEKVVEAKTSQFFLPQSQLKEQSLIHEKIFKDCVKQAATNIHADDRIWKEFEWLFRDYCKAGGNFKQYGDGMRQAASTAWNIISYMQNQQDATNFAVSMENSIFPGLKENMQVDFCQPSLIYELKFTELGHEEYEQNSLAFVIVKAVLHFLVSGVKKERAKLGVLVYYWKTKSIVFYTTDAHQNEELVAMLEEKLSTESDDGNPVNHEDDN